VRRSSLAAIMLLASARPHIVLFFKGVKSSVATLATFHVIEHVTPE
jgi:hypothetical protein